MRCWPVSRQCLNRGGVIRATSTITPVAIGRQTSSGRLLGRSTPRASTWPGERCADGGHENVVVTGDDPAKGHEPAP